MLVAKNLDLRLTRLLNSGSQDDTTRGNEKKYPKKKSQPALVRPP